MGPQEIFLGSLHGLPADYGVPQPRRVKTLPDGGQPGRPFRVTETRLVVKESLVGHQKDRHSASVSRRLHRLRGYGHHDPRGSTGGPYPVAIDVRTPYPTPRGNLWRSRRDLPSVSGPVDVKHLVTGQGTILRISPWRGEPSTVQVVAVGGPAPDDQTINEMMAHLADRGVTTVLTTALAHHDQQPFKVAGFQPVEHLALLHRALDLTIPPAPVRAVHRVRRLGARHLAEALAVDGAAFTGSTDIWRFDTSAFAEACDATDVNRRRLVRRHGRTAGFALTGRTARIGFVQRLAVHPDHQRVGVGSALLADALTWLIRHGVRDVWVNTQPDNRPAQALYGRHGFVPRDEGLAVLRSTAGR